MDSSDSSDGSVLTALALWQARGLDVTLATILKTYGSAPHEVGALHALNSDGEERGVLAGTCLGEWLRQYIKNRSLGTIEVISAGPDAGLALPCGGTIDFLIESKPPPSHIQAWGVALVARTSVRRKLSLDDHQCTLAACETWHRPLWNGRLWEAVYGPPWRLLLIGAGAVSAHLARIASTLDFNVTVCEPRAEVRAGFSVEHVTLTQLMPDDAIASLQPDARTAIVALTHDPRLDDLGLWEAVQTRAFYIGALGSAQSHAKRLGRLASLGVDPHHASRIQGPAGIGIPSRTPAEIAIAIAGSLITERRREPISSTYPPIFLTEAHSYDYRTPSCSGPRPTLRRAEAPSPSS